MNRYIVIGNGLLIVIYRVIGFITIPWAEINQTWAITDAVILFIILLAGIVNKPEFYWLTLVFCILFLLLSLIPLYGNYVSGYPIKVLMFIRPAILLFAIYGIVMCIKGFGVTANSRRKTIAH